MRGSSMSDLGDYNEKLVLQTIRGSEEGIGQSEVGRRANLSRQAVSLITRRLLGKGLIETAGRRSAGPGKPHTLLRVVPDARLTVGVHLDPSHISVVICDLAGRPLAKSILDAPSADPVGDVERIAAEIGLLSRRLEAVDPAHPPAQLARPVPRRLLGIGIAAPGGLDAAAGVVSSPPWLPGWRDVPVARELQRATGLRALLDKDTNAALTGEIWTRHIPASSPVLYIYVGHGVGSAVSAGGQVQRGASTQAGEIGHLPTGYADRRCGCGRHGCLSLYTDAEQMLTAARSAGVALPAEADAGASLQVLVQAAEEGVRGAHEVISRHGAALGHALRLLADIHDPQRIIIGGPLWPLLQQRALPAAQDVLQEWLDAKEAVLESSHLDHDVGAIGAASLFLEQELSPANGVAAGAGVTTSPPRAVGTGRPGS